MRVWPPCFAQPLSRCVAWPCCLHSGAASPRPVPECIMKMLWTTMRTREMLVRACCAARVVFVGACCLQSRFRAAVLLHGSLIQQLRRNLCCLYYASRRFASEGLQRRGHWVRWRACLWRRHEVAGARHAGIARRTAEH